MVRATYTGPAHPIGYVELQHSWVGAYDREDGLQAWALLMERAAKEHPGMIVHGSRVEHVPDGAGVIHNTLYLGLEPKHVSSEPLDPHNLNNSPLPQPGMIEPTDGIVPLGWKEEQFGRGT